LSSKAESLDAAVDHGANTMIHGDVKGWNFFFAKDESPAHKSQPFLFIDMQWAGRGHPLQDVANALTTILEVDDLDKMDDLLDFYIERLGQYTDVEKI
jgi:Ser/Thr protein kinase RdoA (MazF antagonist)